MLQSVGNNVFVQFENTDVLEFKTLKLIKSDIYYWQDGESDPAMEGKVNKILVNPQLATVMANNQKHKVAKGDLVFLHYLAYEWGKDETINIDDKQLNVVNGDFILFKIIDGAIHLVDDLFLGKVVIKEKLTMSGLHINVQDKREPAVVAITHLPKIRKRDVGSIKVGDKVRTIDDYQYIISYKQEDFVVLKSSEIIGTIV